MKPYKDIAKKHSSKEIAESLVFPGDKTRKGRTDALSEFKKFRKSKKEAQSEDEKLIAQLLQLKFIIEDYIKVDKHNRDYDFAYFLQQYIDRLELKKKEFAQEIDIDPAELSLVINRRRKPTEKLILRLDIHSNRNFPAILWFRVLDKDRAYELANDKSIIEKEKRHVKHKLAFTF